MSVRSQGVITKPEANGPLGRLAVPSADRSLGMKMLPGLLSMIAGSADVISFIGLSGLFTAHITGNLIIIAGHVVNGTPVNLAHLLSVPVFIVVLGLTRLLVAGLELAGLNALRSLLLLELLLLAGYLGFSVSAGPGADTAIATLAGMFGVSAMAVQSALVAVSLKGSPSTTVMTTNITRFVMDIGEVLFSGNSDQVAEARRRARHTFPVIIGFCAGAALGAVCFVAAGLWSVMLPTTLALLALAMAVTDHFLALEQSPENRW